jgi:hypothetical protein
LIIYVSVASHCISYRDNDGSWSRLDCLSSDCLSLARDRKYLIVTIIMLHHMKCIWIIRDRAKRVGWTWTWLGNRAGLWLHLFRLCQLRTVRCIDPDQVTDLLSRVYTCLWEREDLFLSCRGFRLFLDRLFRVVIYTGLRRSKHHTKVRPAVLGA